MDEETGDFTTEQPSETSHDSSLRHNSDQISSASEEDWDESDVEEVDNNTSEIDPQAKSFVRWIAALILGFQAAYVLPYNATQWLFTFLHVLFTTLRIVCPTPFILAVCTLLPGSLYLAWRLLKVDEDEFIRYVVCPKCDSIYRFEECIVTSGTQLLSKRCSYVAFKNHPQRRYRAQCNTLLLKTVTLKGGKKKLIARKEYPYMSVIQSLQRLLQDPVILKKCDDWKSRCTSEGVFSDVYDGNIWKDFLIVNNSPFLLGEYTYGLMLNVDWYQPYKHSTYSIGVMYLVVMNLPRSDRYRRKNLIVVGIIPGPTEPSVTINSYLRPLVDELNKLWKGVTMKIPNGEKTIHAALLCTGCDIPAGKKLCGFKGWGTARGCNRCFKIFEGEGFSKSYADFNRASWPKRTNIEYRKQAEEVNNANTAGAREAIETKYGIRYTSLLNLPYYDAIRMSTIVDPLHNLYLGTAKHVLKDIWLERKIFSRNSLESLQEKMDNIMSPQDIGRIPQKIASNFGGFTGNQWKNWTELFSLIVLRDVLTTDDFECWRHFVLASRLLSKPTLTNDELLLADALLLQFCRRCVRLYGDEVTTPNMHLHAHIRECVQDYGPVQSFWLFSFERFNGMLGKQPHNNKSIEVQVMRRFLRDSKLMHMQLPTEFHPEFSILSCISTQEAAEGENESIKKVSSIHLNQMTTSDLSSVQWSVDLKYFKLPTNSTRYILTADEQHYLTRVYSLMYPQETVTAINITVRKYSHVSGPVFSFGSKGKSSHRNSYVLANWALQSLVNTNNPNDYCPGQIQYFFVHSLTLNSELHQHLFAYVLWYEPHPHIDKYGKPLQVWYKNMYQVHGPSNFIPIQRIANRFVFHCDADAEEMIICPLISRSYS